MFRVGYFQFAPRFGAVRANLDRVISALSDVRADVVVLPELPFTGYAFKDRPELIGLAEDPQNSDTVESLKRLCRQRDFYLVTGFAEKADDKIFNSALLLGPEGLIRIYRKLHLFSTEKEVFDPGDTPLQIDSVRGVAIGMMICFDWAFPEVARILALKGAAVICHPANLVLAYCQEAMRTRCLENGVFAVTANRYGTEQGPRGTLDFSGKSQIIGPGGVLIHRSASEADALVIVDIDVNAAYDKKITPQNDLLLDRRPVFYVSLGETD